MKRLNIINILFCLFSVNSFAQTHGLTCTASSALPLVDEIRIVDDYALDSNPLKPIVTNESDLTFVDLKLSLVGLSVFDIDKTDTVFGFKNSVSDFVNEYNIPETLSFSEIKNELIKDKSYFKKGASSGFDILVNYANSAPHSGMDLQIQTDDKEYILLYEQTFLSEVVNEEVENGFKTFFESKKLEEIFNQTYQMNIKTYEVIWRELRNVAKAKVRFKRTDPCVHDLKEEVLEVLESPKTVCLKAVDRKKDIFLSPEQPFFLRTTVASKNKYGIDAAANTRISAYEEASLDLCK